eukprot:TRINITY_DN699_c0_g1_i4.p1 TRINITY_DN699_c0_g1~~TRINITY_DN699_c0_g1_i4.p1  ORF type:complete len:912 (+),score=100.96 TRINITY_DN699_c0_g1_i4:506-3241(+)
MNKDDWAKYLLSGHARAIHSSLGLEGVMPSIENMMPSIEELFSMVDWKALKNPSTALQKLGVFSAPPNHPNKTHIDSLRIPLSQSSLNYPDLQLYQLENLPTPPRKATQALLNRIEACDKGRTHGHGLAVLGPSGCGKTRTDFEVLSLRRGIYFVANSRENGGSSDSLHFTELCAYIPTDDPEPEGDRLLDMLLLSRLIIMKKFYSICGADANYQWMLFQARPRVFGTRDLFVDVFSTLQKCDAKSLMTHVQQLLKANYDETGQTLPIFIDEAQCFLQVAKRFQDLVHPEHHDRSILTKLISSWTMYFETTVILSGIELRLKDVSVLASATLKDIKTLHQTLITDFEGYQELSEFSSYVTHFFPTLSPDLQTKMFNIAQGRFRFSAYLVRCLCCRSEWSRGLGRGIKDELRAFQEFNTSRDYEDDQTSVRYNISQINQKTTLEQADTESPLNCLRKMTIAYYLFGDGYVFKSKEHLKMVNNGICILKQSDGSLKASISEPLVALAAKKFFEDHKNPIDFGPLELMGQMPDLPSPCGFVFERFIVPQLAKYLSQSNLDQLPIVKLIKKSLPSWVVGAQVDLDGSLGFSSERSIKSALEGTGRSVYCPEKNLRKDGIFQLKSGSGHLRAGTIEVKFRAELTDANLTEAIYTTSYESCYTLEKSHVCRSGYENRRQEIIDLYEHKYNSQNGMLRILFLWPSRNQQSTVRGNDLILIFNKDRSPDLLSQKTWNFLDSIKHVLTVEEKQMQKEEEMNEKELLRNQLLSSQLTTPLSLRKLKELGVRCAKSALKMKRINIPKTAKQDEIFQLLHKNQLLFAIAEEENSPDENSSEENSPKENSPEENSSEENSPDEDSSQPPVKDDKSKKKIAISKKPAKKTSDSDDDEKPKKKGSSKKRTKKVESEEERKESKKRK